MASASHRMFVERLPAAGDDVVIDGEEARHAAAAKRLRVGEAIELLDGRGGVADAVVEAVERGRRAGLSVRVRSVRRVEPSEPRLEVLAATPKGGRADDLVDGLSQVGAAAWRPLVTARSVVDPRPTKLDRLDRLAREAAKQCGRAWLLEIGEPVRLEAAQEAAADSALVMADASGEPYEACGAGRIRLLIGPEGGFTEDELAAARRAGARIASFGPHAMRIEVAAVAAAAIILNAERQRTAAGGNTNAPAQVRMFRA